MKRTGNLSKKYLRIPIAFVQVFCIKRYKTCERRDDYGRRTTLPESTTSPPSYKNLNATSVSEISGGTTIEIAKQLTLPFKT